MGRIPVGCQAGSLYGACRQWRTWIIRRAARADRSQSECAVVLADEAEQRAILAPDWGDNASEFAEPARLSCLNTGRIEVGHEEP
jgi:hypothetical protein